MYTGTIYSAVDETKVEFIALKCLQVSEEKTKNTSSDDESVFTKCPPSTLMCPECSVSSKMIPENEHKCNQGAVT